MPLPTISTIESTTMPEERNEPKSITDKLKQAQDLYCENNVQQAFQLSKAPLQTLLNLENHSLGPELRAHCHLILAQGREDRKFFTYHASKAVRRYLEAKAKLPTFPTRKMVILNAFEEAIDAAWFFEEAFGKNLEEFDENGGEVGDEEGEAKVERSMEEVVVEDGVVFYHHKEGM